MRRLLLSAVLALIAYGCSRQAPPKTESRSLAPFPRTTCSPPYSVGSQPPPDCTPYLGGMFKQPLPSTVMSHLYSNSTGIVNQVFVPGGESGWFETVFQSGTTTSPSATNTHSYSNARDDPWYFSSSSDPLWIFDCTNMQCGHDVHTGFSIHIPNGAHFSNTVGDGINDSLFQVWDQTNHEILQMYGVDNMGSGFYNIRTFTCGSPPCTYALSGGLVNSIASNAHSDTFLPDYGDLPSYVSSLHATPLSMSITGLDLMNGIVPHAIQLTQYCEHGSPVFPNTTGFGANPCSPDNTNRPSNGMLFFVDYTDAQIDAMSIPAPKKAILKGLAHYGAYQAETTGDASNSYVDSFQGDEAFMTASATNPLFMWLGSSGISDNPAGGTNDAVHRYIISPFAGVPNLTGPSCATACGPNGHIHVADPCVAKSMAGVSGGCITPVLASIAPSTVGTGVTTPVSLTGSYLVDTTSATVSGSGVTVSGITVVSNTSVSLNLVVSSGAATGSRTITVTNSVGTSNAVNFTIGAVGGTPTLTSVTPNNGNQGTMVPVTVTGTNLTGTTCQVTASSFGINTVTGTCVNATTVTGTLTIQTTAPGTLRDLAVIIDGTFVGNYVPFMVNDVIGPTPGSSGNITPSAIMSNSLTLNWTSASDETTPSTSLFYEVCQSTANNITTVAQCEAASIIVPFADYTKFIPKVRPKGRTVDISTANVTGLSPGTSYYFNVVVRDGAMPTGNKTAYNPVNVTTSGSAIKRSIFQSPVIR